MEPPVLAPPKILDSGPCMNMAAVIRLRYPPRLLMRRRLVKLIGETLSVHHVPSPPHALSGTPPGASASSASSATPTPRRFWPRSRSRARTALRHQSALASAYFDGADTTPPAAVFADIVREEDDNDVDDDDDCPALDVLSLYGAIVEYDQRRFVEAPPAPDVDPPAAFATAAAAAAAAEAEAVAEAAEAAANIAANVANSVDTVPVHFPTATRGSSTPDDTASASSTTGTAMNHSEFNINLGDLNPSSDSNSSTDTAAPTRLLPSPPQVTIHFNAAHQHKPRRLVLRFASHDDALLWAYSLDYATRRDPFNSCHYIIGDKLGGGIRSPMYRCAYTPPRKDLHEQRVIKYISRPPPVRSMSPFAWLSTSRRAAATADAVKAKTVNKEDPGDGTVNQEQLSEQHQEQHHFFHWPDLYKKRERERCIASILDSCWLVNATDIFSRVHCHTLVFEYMYGKTLDHFLDRAPGNCLPETHARFVIFRLLNALQYMHSQGVIHRAVRPSNIYFAVKSKSKTKTKTRAKVRDRKQTEATWNPDSDSDSDADKCTETETEFFRRVITLGDFESACFVPKCGSVSETIGTPPYMSVDIVSGRPYDYASDLWSVGAVLFKMLTGRVPFKGRTPCEFRDAIRNYNYSRSHVNRNGHHRFDRLVESSMSTPAQDLVVRLLQVNPRDRITIEQALLHPWLRKLQLLHLAPTPKMSILPHRARERVILTKCQARLWQMMIKVDRAVMTRGRGNRSGKTALVGAILAVVAAIRFGKARN